MYFIFDNPNYILFQQFIKKQMHCMLIQGKSLISLLGFNFRCYTSSHKS